MHQVYGLHIQSTTKMLKLLKELWGGRPADIEQQIEEANERIRTSRAKTSDGRQTWEVFGDPENEQDLQLMRECMDAELAKARKKKSYFPAPASAWRVAVLLRKQKDYAGEVEAIKAYCEIAATKNYENNTRYTQLRERLPKAQALLAKQEGFN